MTPDRWQRVKELLNEALDLPAAERSAYLDRTCGDDPELRREVDSLVTSHDDAGDFLDGPPIAMPVTTTAVGGTATSRAGERIGSYRIVREIGRGGMGAVYLAIRADDAYRKQVAIKILRRALDNTFVQKRFKSERQILASLDHPNIAMLLDGGSTPDGLPFFVMEYIDGEPVDQYCDSHKLSTTDRLRLFAKICSAVAAAHQGRIVHRDIKPGNILINSAGEPKLLDFGIAKIIDPDGTGGDASEPTVTQLRMLTPEYASPEQIRGEPVSPATDVYSLGVLLYELLTGHKPYKVRSRTPHEIAHAICEEDPEKPSTAVRRTEHTTRGQGHSSITPETVSAVRATQPAELRKRLCGDLDNIVLMAMRKEPNRRYRTAGDLGDDIQRHLEGRPVRARGDTVLYRASKFTERYRGVMAAALLAACGGGLAMLLINGRTHTSAVPLSEFSRAHIAPFTAFNGDEIQPSFSPDGKRIAFIWKGDQNRQPDVYVRDIDATGGPLKLTNSAASDASPVWSPDGRNIAFLRVGKESSGFYLIPSSGGAERKIAPAWPASFERIGRQVSWASDDALVVSDRSTASEPFAIHLLDVDKGTRRRITSPPANSVGDASVAISPDRKRIAFIRVSGSGVNDLFTIGIDGTGEHQITDDRRWIIGITWTANGRDIVFVSNRTGNPALYRVGAAGGEPERLPGIGQNVSDPEFSSDGRYLAYTLFTIDANVWKFDLDRKTPPVGLITSTQYDSSASFSPDGRSLVFRSNRSGTNEIWRCDANGMNAVQLTNFRGPLTGTPRWSPSGNWVAFDSRPEGQAHIYLVPPDGGSPVKFTSSNSENVVPNFSRDGKWIYFASVRTGSWQVWKQPVGGGDAVQVTRNGGFAAAESPDGKYLYFARSRTGPGLMRMPIEGGPETEFLPDLKAGSWGMWAVTPKGIYYLDSSSPAQPAVLYLVNAVTRQKQEIARLDKPLVLATSNVSVSPDGRTLLFTQQDQSSSDIMLAEAASK